MRAGILAVAVAAMVLGGCAQQKKAATTAPASSGTEQRKSVATEQAKSHVIKETADGQYYIMMEQHERLCSDCDR